MSGTPTLALARNLLAATALATTLAALASAAATAQIVAFDEARDGDASDDRFAPTTVALTEGVNTLRGFSGQSPTPDVHDLDYITFTVPMGFQLESFVLQDASVGGAFSFVGLEAGPFITIPADWTSVESPLLGWAHFGSADVGLDLFPTLANSPGSVGFSGPLQAGTYALWIMELDTSEPHTYAFGLGVTAVPAPSALLVSALFGAATRRRSRTRTRSVTAS
jgi:hypothetical protein